MELKYYQSYICIVYINNCTNSCTNMEVETAIFVQVCVTRDPSPTTPTSLTSLFSSFSPYKDTCEVEGGGWGGLNSTTTVAILSMFPYFTISVYTAVHVIISFWPPSFSFSSSFFVRKVQKKTKKEHFMNCRTQTTYS